MIFQLLNLFRIIKRLYALMGQDVLKILFITFALDILFGLLFFLAERNVQDISLLDAIWWALVTMTTVGYGDFYAKTAVGRFIISFPCMILGIGIIGYLIGVVANTIIDFASKKKRGLMQITQDKHIIICNYPGEEKICDIIEEIRAVGKYRECKIVLITEDLEELPESLVRRNILFVKGSPADEDVLFKANIMECDGVIVLAVNPLDTHSDHRTFMIGSIIELIEKEKGKSIKTIVEVLSGKNIRNFKRVAVDGLTSEAGVSSCLIAQEYANPGINTVISQLISSKIGSQLYMVPAPVTGCKMRNLQAAALEGETSLQILGLSRSGEDILNPSKDIELVLDDKLIILAESEEDINTFSSNVLRLNRPQEMIITTA